MYNNFYYNYEDDFEHILFGKWWFYTLWSAKNGNLLLVYMHGLCDYDGDRGVVISY